ncbi:MAG TPA: ATP-binding protein, partial [Nocardioides sp.]|uniref:ATP-binding protein n=1 Tax=Nocardioides sp. TaxID=35761 RepID=UPI002E34219A
VTTAALVNELIEAADDKELSRIVGRYARLDLLCLDELGYVHLGRVSQREPVTGDFLGG